MRIEKFLPRPLRRASLRDLSIGLLRFAAIVYQVYFALYLSTSRYVPPSKYFGFVSALRYRVFILFILAILIDKGLAYVPKKASKVWLSVETERLAATGVATSLMAESVRRGALTEAEFQEIARGLLTAIRFEVQAFAVDQTGYYINVSLLMEDRGNATRLRVVARAVPNRSNRSYPKVDLLVWKAMEGQQVTFKEDFTQAGKPYRSILAIPLLAEEQGISKSTGVISTDSGRVGEFDGGAARNLEQRLAPYTTLLALLLSVWGSLGRADYVAEP